MRDRSFLWTRRLPTAQLLAALPPGLRVARAERLEDRRSVLDTLDRRLSRAGLELALVSAPEGLSLELRDAEGPTLEVPAERAPAWAAELPAELHARVADLLEHRRLLPLWQLAERGTRYRVLDAQDKTVARLALVGREAVALPPPGSAAAPSLRATKLPRRLSLAPLRGYEGEAEEVAKALEEALGSAAESFQDEAQELQVALGLPLAVPATRLVLELDPEEGAERAMRHLVAGLLGLLEAHREGARLGLDAEALHDFRVVLRRLRSTLRELARLAPSRRLERLRQELAWLGERTGPQRDLDVLLEDLDAWIPALPAWCGEVLVPLLDALQRERGLAQREVARALASRRYSRLRERFALLLEGPAATSAPASQPVARFAARRLSRAARRVRQGAEQAGPHSSVAELHRLRILAKRYRYLLELFDSLFPAGELAAIVDDLKELQDFLGRHHDFAVQAEAIRSGAGRWLEGAAGGTEPALALGYLLAKVEERRDALERDLAEVLEAYAGGKHAERERELFSC